MWKEVLETLLKSEVFWTVVFLVVVALISYIIKKTKTTKDDQIWAIVCNAFNVAEKAIPNTGMPTWVAKIDKALESFNTEYYNRYGTQPPESIQQFAKDQWSKLALELKKN